MSRQGIFSQYRKAARATVAIAVVVSSLAVVSSTARDASASAVEYERAEAPACGGLAMRAAATSGGGIANAGSMTLVGSFGAPIAGRSAASHYVLVSGARPASPFARDARTIFCDAFE